MSNTTNTRTAGQQWEAYAEQYLQSQGLVSKRQNFHSRLGEIDLIMQDGSTLVFIEVKYRQSASFGGSLHAISPAKQQKIRKTAAFYLQQHGLNEYNTSCRFDVIALQGHVNQLNVTWLKNAF